MEERVRVWIKDINNHLKYQTIFESFFSDLVWTEEAPDFIVDFGKLIHGQVEMDLPKGKELHTLYLYLETLTPSKSDWGTLLGVRPLKLVHALLDQGKTLEEIRRHMELVILLKPRKVDLLFEIAANQRAYYLKDRAYLSLFLSIPFCPTICSYCNFHTKPYQEKLARSYVSSLLESLYELKRYLDKTGRVIDVVYLGGGTPTALSAPLLTELMDVIDEVVPREQVIEYTIEAGRIDTFSPKHMNLLERADRICINPQSLNQNVLQGVNRAYIEDPAELIRHFEKRGILVNSDLIAGLPGESVDSFTSSLEKLILMKPSNITIHDLSQKRGSAFRERELSEQGVRDMLRIGYETLKKADYRPYYIYRQKNMLANGENVGYETRNTPCLYNIRMMEDAHEIISLGSNAVSKIITPQGLQRIQSIKETTLYLAEPERWKRDMKRFFERDEDK